MGYFINKINLLLLFLIPSTLFPQYKMTVKPDFYFPIKYSEFKFLPAPLNNFGYSFSQTDRIAVTLYQNIRIFPSVFNQTEPSVSISPLNPNRIFVGANTDYGMGYYYTFDGGINWSGGDILPGSVYYSTNPSVGFTDSTKYFYNYYDNFIVVDRSFNSGANWSGRVAVPSSSVYDMNTMAIDTKASSPYSGRIYSAWSDFSVAQPYISLSYSTDEGASFILPPIQIGFPQSGKYDNGPDIATGPNGEVYCVWSVINLSNNKEEYIGFSKSTNGGANWSYPSNPIQVSGIRGFLLNSNIRVNSFPSLAVDKSVGPRNGYLYTVWSQRNLSPAGNDADICFSFSSNGGINWSIPTRVNDDAMNNGKQQFLPSITVDESNGKISVLFYDNRDILNQDSCNIYLAISTDGGINFSNIRISDVPHRPAPLEGYAEGYYSDYIGIAANNDSVFPFWTDNRHGIASIYTAQVRLFPNISHQPLKDTENLNGPYNIQALIKTFGTALQTGETKIFWGRNSITDSIQMTQGSENYWNAQILGNGNTAQYRYYLRTKDVNGRVSALPINAPSGYFSFTTGNDIIKPVITHTPLLFTLKAFWPDTVLAVISDNSGIDSAWVKWYKNSPSNGINQFRLQNVQDDYFRGIFNSSQSQIDYNDSIFYRIYALDISTNKNKDSTALYSLKIPSKNYIFVGNGTTGVNYPFKTFYTDSRTQLLYTSSELSSAGGAAAFVEKIGFNIMNISTIAMNGFTIKMKNTSSSSLTGFDNTGLTTVFGSTYTIPGTGWQYITLTSPFLWNGSNNLLIDVCFDNTVINSNSQVRASSSQGTVWHEYQDNGSGCSFTDGSAQSFKPNLSLYLNFIINETKEKNNISTEYKLLQNFPNPFNPLTKIRFYIPKKDFVILKIFDVVGKEIKILVNEKLDTGIYEKDFDGTGLASGVYLYMLESGTFRETKKMVLIK